MKTNASRRMNRPVPTLSITAAGGEGKGVAENGQTNAAQAPVRPRIRRGGQPGNTNAKKPVLALSTIQRHVRGLKRRIKTALAEIERRENARGGPG